MTLVHADSQEEHSRFVIAPGRLILWNNTKLMHKVDVGDDAEFRVMLGPMSLDVASSGVDGVVQVGMITTISKIGCDFLLDDESKELSRDESCADSSGTLVLSNIGIKSLAPGVLAGFPPVTWVCVCV